MNKCLHSELSSREGTRGQFNGRPSAIKLGIDVHQAFYVVVVQEGGSNPKPPQRLSKTAFLHWAVKLKEKHPEAALHAVYEACGFGFGLQRQLSARGIECHVVSPQKLDERNQRVKTDGRGARTLCLKLSRYVEGNREELAVVRVPTETEEELRALHRQREQLVRTRKQLEAHGRSRLVNHGIEPVPRWWKARAFALMGLTPIRRTFVFKGEHFVVYHGLGCNSRRSISGRFKGPAAANVRIDGIQPNCSRGGLRQSRQAFLGDETPARAKNYGADLRT